MGEALRMGRELSMWQALCACCGAYRDFPECPGSEGVLQGSLLAQCTCLSAVPSIYPSAHAAVGQCSFGEVAVALALTDVIISTQGHQHAPAYPGVLHADPQITCTSHPFTRAQCMAAETQCMAANTVHG